VHKGARCRSFPPTPLVIYHEKANQLRIGFFRLNDNANNQD